MQPLLLLRMGSYCTTQFKRVVQTAVKVHKTGSFREIFRHRRMGIHRVGSWNCRTVQPVARV